MYRIAKANKTYGWVVSLLALFRSSADFCKVVKENKTHELYHCSSRSKVARDFRNSIYRKSQEISVIRFLENLFALSKPLNDAFKFNVVQL